MSVSVEVVKDSEVEFIFEKIGFLASNMRRLRFLSETSRETITFVC